MHEFLDRYRAFAATFEGAHEDFRWGQETPVFKNAKEKIFAMTGVGDDGLLRVTVKLSPGDGSAALGLPFVSKAAYVGRFGWVNAVVSDEPTWDAVCDWTAQSYHLVAPKPRKKAAKPG